MKKKNKKLKLNLNIFENKKALITGHTGFKGSWLTLWLLKQNAKILGISNKIITEPSNYNILKKNKNLKSKFLDIKNYKKLSETIKNYKPDFIFHFAAQSLVKKSYNNPRETFLTNSIGTMNILDSLRSIKRKCVVILITSDKSYKNLEIKRGYKETDLLGGIDPYSASKASAELIIQSYINSYFRGENNKILICVGRAGNVIGGGDWSQNRLIPDCVKFWSKNQKVLIRNPRSTRPWQHVLEALRGYLFLASNLYHDKKLHGEVFNFGPNHKKNYSVLDVIKIFQKKWKSASWKIENNKDFYESNLLKLNSNKAKKILKYSNILSFHKTVSLTAEWYNAYYEKKVNMYDYSIDQIKKFENLVKSKK
tara:strand:- start:302 stop:1402 length:1101 start_codon:yes stop_codon:yes gene_type:complete